MHRPKTYRRKSRKAGGKRSTKRRGGMSKNVRGGGSIRHVQYWSIWNPIINKIYFITMHRPKTYRRKSRKAGKRSTKKHVGAGRFGGRRTKRGGGMGQWFY